MSAGERRLSGASETNSLMAIDGHGLDITLVLTWSAKRIEHFSPLAQRAPTDARVFGVPLKQLKARPALQHLPPIVHAQQASRLRLPGLSERNPRAVRHYILR